MSTNQALSLLPPLDLFSEEWDFAIVDREFSSHLRHVFGLDVKSFIHLNVVQSICNWDYLICCFFTESCRCHGIKETAPCRKVLTLGSFLVWHAIISTSRATVSANENASSSASNSTELDWSDVLWAKNKPLMLISDGSIKIFPFGFWSINVIFAIHYLEVVRKLVLNVFSRIPLWRVGIYRLSAFPIVLNISIKKLMLSNSIRGSFKDVPEMILWLFPSTSLVEKLLIMGVVAMVIFGIGNVGSVVPSWNMLASRIVNTT